uniref:Class II aldolase/adducin N-terminal domain-containing protein n=1 Tax=Ciona intestinalis TaxID=7719 RepID=F7B9Q3_CIOIN
MGIHPGRRPINIENDVSSLGQKKRVSNILTSPYFKEELESAVTDLLRSGNGGGHVIAKEIANFFSPAGRVGQASGIGCVSPINDLTGADSSLYDKGEKLLRCKLSVVYRLVDLYGWSQTIFNHITLRTGSEQEHFLINPFGLLYHEVSASKLLKVNMQGDVLDQGSTTLGFNQAGYTLHSAIHAARPDIHCVIHVHTSDIVAISAMECGLLPLSQEAMVIGEVSYHNYQGILVDNKEKKSIQKHLGPNNKVMFLRNHGLVACGESVEEAFFYLNNAMLACSTQIKAMSCMRPEKLILLDRAALKARTADMVHKDITGGVNVEKPWTAEMMFEGLVRMLDDMGYRSGYQYRNPVIYQPKQRVKYDVELPAYALLFPPYFTGNYYVQKKAFNMSLYARGSLRRTGEGSRWVNSPNQYTRVTEKPDEDISNKNFTNSPPQWKRKEEAAPSTSVKINNPNQFVPTNTNPRDVLNVRKSIRGQSRKEVNKPGPQSQLLHSVSPERSGKNHNIQYIQGEGDKVMTSSKGIIQRGEDVVLVAPAGPPNPFNEITSEDLQKYQQEVSKGKDPGSTPSELVAPSPSISQTPSPVPPVPEDP